MQSKEVSTGKFYMLRCVIAMAHADGIVTQDEIGYISHIMNRLNLRPEQRQILEFDLKAAQRIEDLFPYINEPRFRGQAVDFARIMAFKDGHLHPSEEELLRRLHAYAMDGIDMDSVRASVREAVSRELQLHDITINEGRPVKSGHVVPWFQLFDEASLALGRDLMDE